MKYFQLAENEDQTLIIRISMVLVPIFEICEKSLKVLDHPPQKRRKLHFTFMLQKI